MIDPKTLSDQLVEAFLLESERKVVAVFAGRFNPYHPGHHSIYKLLVNKFGSNNVYIGTSNIVDSGKSPFSFEKKKKIISTMFGVPTSKIQQVKNPFKPEEILSKFSEDTVYVTAFSEKDAGRLGGKYFKPYNSVKAHKGYRDEGYYVVAPELQAKVMGKNVSGTQIRTVFGSNKVSLADKKKIFTQLYGKFDKDIFELITKTLKKEAIVNTENGVLQEGGASGHMAHPFEDMNLTFADLKQLIDLGLSGRLNIEAPVTEKLDGQAISVSWKNGKAIFARNKTHIKNAGADALDVRGISQMFSGRGQLSAAFSTAANDLHSAIAKLTDAQRNKIFGEGRKFMAVEVIYSATQNVIPYGVDMLVFHDTTEYDKDGNSIGRGGGEGRILAGMIKQINAHIQQTFGLQGPNIVTLPKSENFSKDKSKYFSRLQALQSRFGLSDSDKVVEYHIAWWNNLITTRANSLNYAMPNRVLGGLIKRWALQDKSYKVADMRQDITHNKFLDWALKYDSSVSADQFKRNIRPFESLFLDVGAQILSNAQGFLAVNPDKTVQSLASDVEKAANEIRNSGDIKKIAKLNTQLKRLASIQGAIAPSEGIVFTFKNKIYKATGTFAPINQILGTLKY